MADMSSELRLKILCLHGYNQNGNLFKKKLGAFRKSIKMIADLVFVDAPHVIPLDSLKLFEGEDTSFKGGRSWWFSTNEGTFNSSDSSMLAEGFQDSVDHIKDIFHLQGPFDGILGFSQGAAFAALICGLQQHNEFPHSFNFVMLISGFKSLSTCHLYLYETRLKVTSLHIIGQSDKVITRDKSEDLSSLFVEAHVTYHDGGHFLPTCKNIKSAYNLFLKNMFNFHKV